jgi:hypothetical protein
MRIFLRDNPDLSHNLQDPGAYVHVYYSGDADPETLDDDDLCSHLRYDVSVCDGGSEYSDGQIMEFVRMDVESDPIVLHAIRREVAE